MHSPIDTPLHSSAPGTSLDESWFVSTRSGVVALTLDELDEAYQRGAIDARTPVFTPGMAAWSTLGALAHLDEGSSENEPTAPPLRAREAVSRPGRHAASYPPTTRDPLHAQPPFWASITTPLDVPSTGVRRKVGLLPALWRRVVASVAPRGVEPFGARGPFTALGPWLFGAALSAVFAFSVYRLSTLDARPSAHPAGGGTAPAGSGIPAHTPAANAGPVTSAGRAGPITAASTATPGAPLEIDEPAPVLRVRDLRLTAGGDVQAAPTKHQMKGKKRARAGVRARATRRNGTSRQSRSSSLLD